MRLLIALSLLILFFNSSFGQNGNQLFDPSYIHEIYVYTDNPNFWEVLLSDYDQSAVGENVYQDVDIIIDGTRLNDVGFRIKGFFSAWGTSGYKKPFRIDLNEFVSGQSYDDIKKISLNNVFMDPSSMRDMLAYDLMRTAGVPAPRTTYAKVYINDSYWGLYIMAEQIDKTFLSNNFEDDNGNLYKAIGWTDLGYLQEDLAAYKLLYELKTNETEDDWSGFFEFLKYANKVDVTEEEYKEQFPKLFDIPNFLKALAIDVLINSWDSFFSSGRNFYIYHNPDNGKMTWIPWDYNLSFSATQANILAQGKPIINNILQDPVMQWLLIDTYKDILKDNFTQERLYPLINETKALIRDDLSIDPNAFYTPEQFDTSLEETTSTYHKDTFQVDLDLDSVFLFSNWNYIPTWVFEQQLSLLDTTQCAILSFDMVVNEEGEENEFVHCTQIFEYTDVKIGLKDFISDRIEQVNVEINELIKTLPPRTVTSVDDELQDLEFSLFPNPSSHTITLAGLITKSDFQVMMYDLKGQEVLTDSNQTQIDIQHLKPGFYVVMVNNQQQLIKRKFVKLAQ